MKVIKRETKIIVKKMSPEQREIEISRNVLLKSSDFAPSKTVA